MQSDFWVRLLEVKRKCVLRGRKYGILYESDKLLAEQWTLYVAAVGIAWLVLDAHWNTQAMLYVFWTHNTVQGVHA
jgi:hypothetical protein